MSNMPLTANVDSWKYKDEPYKLVSVNYNLSKNVMDENNKLFFFLK